MSMGAVFVLGLALQLLALRTLDPNAYGTFVLSLGVATIAATVASSVQPLVALRVISNESAYLPLRPTKLLPVVSSVTLVLWFVLSDSIGAVPAAFVAIQVPMHLTVGFAGGIVQGRRSFGPLGFAMASWSAARLGSATLLLLLGVSELQAFLAALDIALLVQAGLLLQRISWTRACWTGPNSIRSVFSESSGWLAGGWLIFGDAIMCRLLLSAVPAARYGLALTLGRQAVFAAGPFSSVLLTVAHDEPDRQSRMALVAAISVGLSVCLALGVGAFPSAAVRLLTGSERLADPWLIRGYVVLGGLGAAGSLLMAWAGGSGRMPSRVLCIIALIGLIALSVFGRSPGSLLVLQGLTLVVLVAVTAKSCLSKPTDSVPKTSV